jgi:uncharacterized protein (DUF302 family)
MEFNYGFSVDAGNEFDVALQLVVDELRKEAFGIVSDIDMAAIFRDKLGVHEPRYRILGACNPSLALQALREDPNIGLLLPCNIVVREDARGNVTVAFMAPDAVLKIVRSDSLEKLGFEVRRRLDRVRHGLDLAARRLTPVDENC